MVTRLADLFPQILLAAATSVLLSPILIQMGPKLGLMDLPHSAPHKRHEEATPTVGGPVIAIALTAAYSLLRVPLGHQGRTILLAAMLMLILGLLDDRYGLRAYQKLLGQLVVACILLLMGIQVQITRIPILDVTLSLLWFVGIINAFNFVDSMDGLALGLAAVASAFFMLVAIDSGQPWLAQVAAGLLGACIGIYPFNAMPARLFLGDSGAQLLGCLLAAMGVAYVPGGAGLPQAVSWFTPILVLGVPIFDTALVVTSRLRRRAPLFKANRDHSYHRLLALGLDPTRSVLAMHLAAIVLGLIAFIALDATVLLANALFAVIALFGIGAILVLDHRAGRLAGRQEPAEK